MKLFNLIAPLLVSVAVSATKAKSWCKGRKVRVNLDFEIDRNGKSFSAGDTPSKLPGGFTVRGFRRNKTTRTKNDLVIFDTAHPTGNDKDLFSTTEKHVLVINKNRNKGSVFFIPEMSFLCISKILKLVFTLK